MDGIKMNRRQFAALFGVSAATVTASLGLSPISTSEESNPYRIRQKSVLRTKEPLVRDTGVEIGQSFPYQYSAIITSEEDANRVRREYARSEFDISIKDSFDVDYKEEFQVFAGLILPNSLQIDLYEATVKDRTVETSYDIIESKQVGDELQVHTGIQVWVRGDKKPPEKIAPSFRFK